MYFIQISDRKVLISSEDDFRKTRQRPMGIPCVFPRSSTKHSGKQYAQIELFYQKAVSYKTGNYFAVFVPNGVREQGI